MSLFWKWMMLLVSVNVLISTAGESLYHGFVTTTTACEANQADQYFHSWSCSSIMALLAIILANINLQHCIPHQSAHPLVYLQSFNSHHAAGKVWRECVLLVTESPVNPQTASEAKMDAPIRTATVKDGDKGFYTLSVLARSPHRNTQSTRNEQAHYFQSDSTVMWGWLSRHGHFKLSNSSWP